MSTFISSFSGMSVDNQIKARDFYTDLLGFKIVSEDMGLTVKLPSGSNLFIYEKPDHEPAEFTVLNLVVEDIDKAVDELSKKGVDFEQYDLGNGAVTDEKGVLRGKSAGMGPNIAWFKDPAGNILSLIEE